MELFSDYVRFKELMVSLGEDLKTQEESSNVGGEVDMMGKLQNFLSGSSNMNVTLAIGLLTEY